MNPDDGATPTVFEPGSGVAWPALLLKEPALRHNADLMARFCAERGVSLAPHGKTAVSPELWEFQERVGAWGVSVATPAQARVFRRAGARRILMANQLVDPAFAAWVQAELAGDRGFEFLCYVDSVAGVRLLEAALEANGPALPVLLEVGHPGGRTGCRTAAAVDEVARAVAASAVLALVGLAGYEGSVSHSRDPEALGAVAAYLGDVVGHFERVAGAGRLDGRASEYLLSAGGSLYFDVVAEVFGAVREAGRPVRTVLRSGAYLTHDHGLYRRLSPLGSAADGGFIAAGEVWAQVLSVPEPGLVILNAGRRDVPYDQGLPVPLGYRRDGVLRPLEDAEVFELNDQHAFVRTAAGAEPAVGELVVLGTSHPCTLHDKWPRAVLVDDAYRQVGTVHSYF
ncbi:amino acid deaminase [Occultella glacieicola]|uniref:Amino acid deaminase n=1 Tax=Occultella glacieicola TaxID=2518684 RepID=A0ABY2E3F7_9MICO|nr:alanine racemase [Occultella glacieicola]TDE89544.1 amino acid deaminase [Occultella glacieicola]